MLDTHIPLAIPTKILLPIDFSPASHKSLEIAAGLALYFHAELFLVNVIPEMATLASEYAAPPLQFQYEDKGKAEKRLESVKSVLSTRGVNAGFSVEVGNDTVASIMEVVFRENIDFLVISTHGISDWSVFGSKSEKVIKHFQWPILLLHSTKTVNVGENVESDSGGWW